MCFITPPSPGTHLFAQDRAIHAQAAAQARAAAAAEALTFADASIRIIIDAALQVAGDNARATFVFISGATLSSAVCINGFFEPTEDRGNNGSVVYSKRGSEDICIEHVNGKWKVKPKSVKCRGREECFAYFRGACALEACTSRAWSVLSGGNVSHVPTVKMVAGSEAERQVSSCCMRTC